MRKLTEGLRLQVQKTDLQGGSSKCFTVVGVLEISTSIGMRANAKSRDWYCCRALKDQVLTRDRNRGNWFQSTL